MVLNNIHYKSMVTWAIKTLLNGHHCNGELHGGMPIIIRIDLMYVVMPTVKRLQTTAGKAICYTGRKTEIANKTYF